MNIVDCASFAVKIKTMIILKKTYNLFISHAWEYTNRYAGLRSLLLQDSGFSFKDYSVPKDDPIHTQGTDQKLYIAIRQKISRSSVVLIIAGIDATYSKWIKKEIQIAKNGSKPIIAIKPWGNDKISQIAKEHADRIVNWNTDSIVDAIKELCNHE